jgi:RNA polymerase sigma factor (sigma-70 family)
MQKVSDEEVLAAKTDRKMQEKVLKKCSGLIEHWVYRLRCRNVEEAEDVRQEACLGVLKAIQTFERHPKRGNHHFAGWATFWIRAYGGRRRWGVHGPAVKPLEVASSLDLPIGDEGDETYLDALEGTEPSPHEAVERAERHALVNEVLTKLDERSRHLWQERFVEGKTLQQVGDELGLSRERVRQLEDGTHGSLVQRSRRALHAALFGDPYEPLPPLPKLPASNQRPGVVGRPAADASVAGPSPEVVSSSPGDTVEETRSPVTGRRFGRLVIKRRPAGADSAGSEAMTG